MRRSFLLLILLFSGSASCLHAQHHTSDLKQITASNTVSKLETLIPKAFEWYEATEKKLLVQGRSLSKSEVINARKLGVSRPERVRVVILAKFPMPTDRVLLTEAKRFGFGSRAEIGRTMGDAILVKPHGTKDPTVVAHELVHVAQQDRLGKEQFVRQILTELMTVGYEKSPLEIEAYAKQGVKASLPKSN
jgi:hypothetical protein